MRRLALTLLSLLLATALCTAQQLSKKMTNKDGHQNGRTQIAR